MRKLLFIIIATAGFSQACSSQMTHGGKILSPDNHDTKIIRIFINNPASYIVNVEINGEFVGRLLPHATHIPFDLSYSRKKIEIYAYCAIESNSGTGTPSWRKSVKLNKSDKRKKIPYAYSASDPTIIDLFGGIDPLGGKPIPADMVKPSVPRPTGIDTLPKKNNFLLKNMTGYYIQLYINQHYIVTLAPYDSIGPIEVSYSGKEVEFYAKGTGGTSEWSKNIDFNKSLINIENAIIIKKVFGGKPVKNISVIPEQDEITKNRWAEDSVENNSGASFKLFDFRKQREIKSGIVYEGDQFSVDIHFPQATPKKYIYVIIYSNPANEAHLMYPNEFSTGEENRFPKSDENGKLIVNFSPVNIEVVPPFGTDTYVLLATGEPIKDLSLFQNYKEILLLLKGNPLSRFHEILKGDYYLKTLEVQARPANETTGLVPSNNNEGGTRFFSTEDSSETFYSPTPLTTFQREDFPIISFIEPSLETKKGVEVLVKTEGKKIVFRGHATDRINGVKKITINNEPPQTYLPAYSGYFDYSYELIPGENKIEVSVENNKGYRKNYRLVFNYQPEKKEESGIANNYLLVIGINDYKSWTPLYNSTKDAMEFKQLMVQTYGYEEKNIVELYDSAATRNNIINQLEQMLDSLKENDRLLIYYSGHGFYNEQRRSGYWIPSDAMDKTVGTYISNADITGYIREIKAKNIFMIADACYSGSILPDLRKENINNHDYKSRMVLCSGKLQVVPDGDPGTNSPFAKKIFEFFKTNNDKEIKASKLINYVKESFTNPDKQKPVGGALDEVGDENGDFIFIKNK